jgi:hypothetical protein
MLVEAQNRDLSTGRDSIAASPLAPFGPPPATDSAEAGTGHHQPKRPGGNRDFKVLTIV